MIVEATGAGQLVLDAIGATALDGIVCLTGVSPAGRELTIDAGSLNRAEALEQREGDVKVVLALA